MYLPLWASWGLQIVYALGVLACVPCALNGSFFDTLVCSAGLYCFVRNIGIIQAGYRIKRKYGSVANLQALIAKEERDLAVEENAPRGVA